MVSHLVFGMDGNPAKWSAPRRTDTGSGVSAAEGQAVIAASVPAATPPGGSQAGQIRGGPGQLAGRVTWAVWSVPPTWNCTNRR